LGGTCGKINNLSPQLIFWKQTSMYGTSMGTDLEFRRMLKFVEKHEIRPVVDAKFPLANGNIALQKMASGGQFGKLILEI
jgi:zinc-binding alcohol dehydrogenase/oxidoreductase